jgi:Zn-dependent protease with chaperone function
MAILAVPVSMLVLCTAIPVRIELWAGLDPSLLLLVGVIAYLFVALGWYSRRLEHEADLWACRLLATHLGQPRALGQYLEVLLRLSDPRHRHRGSWLHPGHNRRRAFLISKLANQRRADAFQREMKWLALLVGALVVLPLVVVFAP